jgi:hypothetical protein
MLWEFLGRFSPTILNLSTLKVDYNPYGVKTRGQWIDLIIMLL